MVPAGGEGYFDPDLSPSISNLCTLSVDELKFSRNIGQQHHWDVISHLWDVHECLPGGWAKVRSKCRYQIRFSLEKL